ncbi:MAG: 1-acyl-sn-glycerol-3-phosphate acyltransferase [Alphaproteobacteria bacterium]|nr:1-acyl-sn-glycerol-3-phosphate acyltransferase [Alphaproteobacteria bacterium]MDE2041647.1 1-acyl-sn-glycerol-3-phosphate acyltransferase [Alphaproteobacteria bacterium]MDE2340570.1 1-acyl-sn-glycerol-3-phosphate acyltransferase [Alphaproteobacteria bacterium]
MKTLRTWTFNLIFYGGTLCLLMLTPFVLTMARSSITVIARRWGRWHRWCSRAIYGISSIIEGTLPQHRCIVAIKHESFFEAIELLAQFEAPAVVLKQELADLPLWGALALAHGVIPVDRATGSAALRRMLSSAKIAMAQDRPIIIFPEGTRVAPGESPPLKPGLFGLYKLLNLPVVPVAINSGRLWPKKGAKRSGTVTWAVGETIPPGLPRAQIEAQVHAAINRLNPAPHDPAR